AGPHRIRRTTGVHRRVLLARCRLRPACLHGHRLSRGRPRGAHCARTRVREPSSDLPDRVGSVDRVRPRDAAVNADAGWTGTDWTVRRAVASDFERVPACRLRLAACRSVPWPAAVYTAKPDCSGTIRLARQFVDSTAIFPDPS